MSERDQFGPRLRREREKRGITLQQIASRTKISASFFEALERNDFSRWPGGIFRRSFLRGYAESVGVDADSVVRDCARLFPSADEQAAAAGGAAWAAGEDRGPGAARHEARDDAADHRRLLRACLLAACAIAAPGAVTAALILGGPYVAASLGVAVCAVSAGAVFLAMRQHAAPPAVDRPVPESRPVATAVRTTHAHGGRQGTPSHHVAKRRGQRDRPAPPPQRRRGERSRPRV